ncbi:MAG: cytochrome C oxidase subunit IV family protein [Kofleriaceae bacterium]
MSDLEHNKVASTGRTLVGALVLLVVLTVTSWAIQHLDLGDFGTPAALAIAVVKASIVAIAFMEIGGASRPARVMAAITVVFIALLCAGTVADVVLR